MQSVSVILDIAKVADLLMCQVLSLQDMCNKDRSTKVVSDNLITEKIL